MSSAHDTTQLDAWDRLHRQLPIGTRVGRYLIASFVGEGAMGVVHAAWDPELQRKVAIKLLRARAGSGSLLREAKVMAQLAHPNVVAVHDVGLFEGDVFVAMELIEGVDLRAWLREHPRSLRQILDAFTQAGRGLAAAHAAGLVHRDFKPDNVLIGPYGPQKERRVCVGDFGLATADRSPATDTAREVLALELGGSTRTGFVVGTPAYIAPEQHRGVAADARADQFAFCVALWEAVHGKRPFDERSVEARLASILRGQLEPAQAKGVPGWLRRVLVRGLQADPSLRHRDMDDLLAGLAPTSRRRLRVVPIAALAIVVATLGAAVAGAGERCTASLWSGDARDAVDERLRASDRPFAEATADAVITKLDAFDARWTHGYETVCRAHEDATKDGAMACLRRDKAAFTATIAALVDADDALLLRAADMVERLPEPGRCPSDPAEALPADTAAEVAKLRDELAAIGVSMAAARYFEADARSEAVLVRARELGYAPLLAEALLEHGVAILNSRGQNTGLPIFEEAALVATAAGHDRIALRAWDQLAMTQANLMAEVERAPQHLRDGDAALARIVDTDGTASAEHMVARGRVLEQRLQYAEARDAYREAIELATRVYGEDDARLGRLATSLSRVEQELGDFVAADTWARSAEERVRARLGDHHPAVADALTQRGTIAHRQGDYPSARVFFVQALAIREAAYPTHHTILADSHNNLALVEMALGDFEAARLAFERALIIERRRDDPFAYAQTLHNLGAVEIAEDHPEAAEARVREAMRIFEQALGPDDPRMCGSYETLASLLLETGEYDEARTLLQRSIALWERSERTEHPGYGGALAELGRLQHRTGEDATAIPTLERALAIVGRQNLDPWMIVHTRHDLAEALWAVGRHDDARAENERARAMAANLLGGDADRIRGFVDEWARTHPSG